MILEAGLIGELAGNHDCGPCSCELETFLEPWQWTWIDPESCLSGITCSVMFAESQSLLVNLSLQYILVIQNISGKGQCPRPSSPKLWWSRGPILKQLIIHYHLKAKVLSWLLRRTILWIYCIRLYHYIDSLWMRNIPYKPSLHRYSRISYTS